MGSLLLPGLSDSALNWFNAQHAINAPAGADPGSNQPIALDPLVSLRRQLLRQPNGVMFTYRTNDPSPGYLRAAVLSAYNGESFYPLVAGSGVNPTSPEGVALQDLFRGTPAWNYEFTGKQLSSPYLPVPENFFDLAGSSPGWLIDPSTLQVSGANTRGELWHVSTSPAPPTAADMRAAPNLAADEQKNLLTGVPQPLIDQAKLLTKNSATKYDAAVAIQQWLRSTFTYSTEVKSDESSSYLTQFLKDRKGYCEQFAATMALMSRAIGIPARVVVGFTAGTKQSDGSWSVSPHQAHAWPELFLGQWVRFEPTPRAQVDGSGVSVPSWSLPQAVVTPSVTPGQSLGQTARNRRDQELRRDRAAARRTVDLGRDQVTAPPANPDRWRWLACGVAVIAAIATALAPAARRWWRRRSRMARGDIDGAWEELRDTMLDLGRTWSDAATPRQLAVNMIEVQHLQGDAAQAAKRLCQTTELARYSPRAPRVGRVSADVRTVRQALLRRMDRGTRIRATLRPASVVSSRTERD
jgi:transglutaminase-like putative cysteine protease